MRLKQILETSAGATGSGSIATVSSGIGNTQSRASIYGDKKVGSLFKGKKTKKPYANSLSEGKVKQLAMDLKTGPDGLTDQEFKKKYNKTKAEMRQLLNADKAKKTQDRVEEAKLSEEDKILAPGKGSKLKPGLLSKEKHSALSRFILPFKANGLWVSDHRGNPVLECAVTGIASEVAKALNMHANMNEMTGGVIAGGIAGESRNNDRSRAEYENRVDRLTNSILYRIEMTQPELADRFGDEALYDAAREVAEFNADSEEIGTSDISIFVRQVRDNLRDRGRDSEYVSEKAVSKAQQRFMGMVHAVQKGEMKSPSKEVAKVAKGMTKKAGHDYAATKHKGLPEKVKKDK